jgi:plastocyanin
MKNILAILAILLVFAACAPQAQETTSQQQEVTEPQVAELVHDAAAEASPAEKVPMGETAPLNDDPAQGVIHEVEIKGFRFTPSVVTIRAGDSVRWTNRDEVKHNAQGDGFETPLLAKDETAKVAFDKPGSYTYICTPHPGMRGKIIVQ